MTTQLVSAHLALLWLVAAAVAQLVISLIVFAFIQRRWLAKMRLAEGALAKALASVSALHTALSAAEDLKAAVHKSSAANAQLQKAHKGLISATISAELLLEQTQERLAALLAKGSDSRE